ncbi:helix-turn-helix transcriptional regulator [Paenibacillus flagellatus]|uniref:LuxR family transcriptional regulator n=1 Tax=Paenibacillus flagellatus TaxID=2211139 RepID=A0A2V5K1Q2_9BACL|nr:LuxR family transcriptional regulator [Paenibacillus flagellatus]PYI53088.1 LuxR family transcriptional regulator [Paenibacillus flagellatus]
MAFENHALARREKQFVVGRERELQYFRQVWDAPAEEGARMLHVYGTGGMGKSTYLKLCQDAAEAGGARFLLLDSRDFVHTEEGFCSALETLLLERDGDGARPVNSPHDVRRRCLDRLIGAAERSRLVLALDTFEELADMEAWLRDRFIPWLPGSAIVLLAGRHPLKGTWVLSPAWRERLTQFPISSLGQEESREYGRLCGIHDDRILESIWRRSRGHPLTLSMAVAAHFCQWDPGVPAVSDGLEEIASLWLREVPDEELRTVVEAASVLRRFDQEVLSFVMERELSIQGFERLTSLSFVRRSVNGWQVHDLVSEITAKQLKERAPMRYYRYRERSAHYYAKVIVTSSGQRSVCWEIGELFRYAGVRVVRALASDTDAGGALYWEPVTESTLEDAVAYTEWRQRQVDGISGWETDPDTGEQFRIEYSADALRLGASGIDVRELFALDPEALKLLRDGNGSVHSLSVIIPIHQGTRAWLENDPICRPYLDALTPAERNALGVPGERPTGWFLRVMDFRDLMDSTARTQGLYLLYTHMCRGGVFVCSPYTTDISKKVYPALGFTTVDGAEHTNYDGRTPTYTYVMDTRGSKLRDFIGMLFRKAGLEWREPASSRDGALNEARKPGLLKQFTSREQEVIEQVLSGCSNSEVARKLFISEVTVKKHLRSIYAKLGVSTRTQLISKLMTES